MIEWIIAAAIGALLTGCLIAFWDSIKEWLNTVAADAVERVLGYGARYRMQKAVAFVDRVVQRIRNRAVIYTKKYNNSLYFDKTTVIAECSVKDIEQDVLDEINKNGQLIQEFDYRQS